jgi:ribosome-binding ATPase YchF (GTP1/OBG family)
MSSLGYFFPLSDDPHSSDFENKFVCGEIMSYNDLQEYGSESAVKAAGKLRQQGKPYESTFSMTSFTSKFC